MSGDTSGDLIKRIGVVHGVQTKLAIVLIGTNDTVIPVPVSVYAENLLTIEKMLENVSILWCTLPPIMGYGLPHYKHPLYITMYNQVIAGIAGTNVVDFSDMGEYLIDTVHFCNRGYKEMARRIHDKLGVVSWQ